jgi:hypothetical protein
VLDSDLEDVPQPWHSPIPMETGFTKWPSGKAIAPLSIRTSSGQNYFVRIVNSTTGRHEAEIFINGGDVFRGKLPIGSYSIRYAAGWNWYGMQDHFGKRTYYSEAQSGFDFRRTDDGVSGYTIELIRQKGGNLVEFQISRMQFDQ